MQGNSNDKNAMLNEAKRLSGRSEDELLETLAASVAKGRADGSFTPEKLEAFVRRVSPMLNAAQRERLNGLIKQLDDK